jgi:hypothetical protein
MRNAMSGRFVCSLAALAAVVGAAPIQAQSVSLEPGVRARVFTPSVDTGGLAGTVVLLVRDTLIFRPDRRSDTLTVALSELSRLELSKGKHTHALKGCGIGLLLGAAGGAIAGHTTTSTKDWFLTPNEAAAVGGGILGVAGALVGATIGSHFGVTESWAQVPIPSRSRVSIVPRDGAMALSYSFVF